MSNDLPNCDLPEYLLSNTVAPELVEQTDFARLLDAFRDAARGYATKVKVEGAIARLISIGAMTLKNLNSLERFACELRWYRWAADNGLAVWQLPAFEPDGPREPWTVYDSLDNEIAAGATPVDAIRAAYDVVENGRPAGKPGELPPPGGMWRKFAERFQWGMERGLRLDWNGTAEVVVHDEAGEEVCRAGTAIEAIEQAYAVYQGNEQAGGRFDPLAALEAFAQAGCVMKREGDAFAIVNRKGLELARARTIPAVMQAGKNVLELYPHIADSDPPPTVPERSNGTRPAGFRRADFPKVGETVVLRNDKARTYWRVATLGDGGRVLLESLDATPQHSRWCAADEIAPANPVEEPAAAPVVDDKIGAVVIYKLRGVDTPALVTNYDPTFDQTTIEGLNFDVYVVPWSELTRTELDWAEVCKLHEDALEARGARPGDVVQVEGRPEKELLVVVDVAGGGALVRVRRKEPANVEEASLDLWVGRSSVRVVESDVGPLLDRAREWAKTNSLAVRQVVSDWWIVEAPNNPVDRQTIGEGRTEFEALWDAWRHFLPALVAARKAQRAGA